MRPMLVVLLVTGCPDPQQGKPQDTPAACAEDGACADGEICDAGACVVGDRDDEMTDASSIVWEEEVAGEIAPEGDVDWYAIQAAGGEFVRAATVVDDEELLDTVVSLYDSVGHRITWEDEHPMASISGMDSIAYGYFPEAGTYYARVEDRTSFYGEAGSGVERAGYTLSLRSFDAPDETDALDDPAYDLDTLSADTWYSIPVLLEGPGDTDWVSFELPYTNAPLYVAAMSNDETSEATPSVSLWNSAGARVLTLDDPTADAYARLPDALDVRYTLGVTDADADGGALHWTWVFLVLRDEGDPNPREVEPNDAPETATAMVMDDQDVDTGEWLAAYGGGWIDPVDDVDTWLVEAPSDGWYLTVAFGAQEWGGLLVARIEVLDAEGTVLTTVDATAGEDASLANLGPYAAGPLYLRFSPVPDLGTPGGEGAFYQFGAHLTTERVED